MHPVLSSPRWLALHITAIVLVIACIVLGLWQYTRYQEHSQPRLRADPVTAPLDQVLPLEARIGSDNAGRRVTVSGSFDASNQLLVADRDLDGVRGLLVLTPLRLADGSAIPVVRGWVARADDPATAVPTGTVTVAGRLEPSEPPPAATSGRLPPGQVSLVSTAALLNVWPYPLRDGYLAMASQTPAASGPRPVEAAPPAARSGGRAWQNAAYTIQWWFFGGFVVFMWWRMVREEVRPSRDGGSAHASGAPGPPEADRAASAASATKKAQGSLEP